MRTLQDSRPACGDVSGGLPVSAPPTSLVWWSNAHRDIAGVAFGHPKGEPPGVRTLHSSRPDCGDASGGLLVSAPSPRLFSFCGPNAHRDIAGVAFGHPRGEPPGGMTLYNARPDCGDVSSGLLVWWLGLLCFQSRLRGCLERDAGFSTPKGEPPGCFHVPVRAQIAGMSRVVCLFGGLDLCAFIADYEDVSSEALPSEQSVRMCEALAGGGGGGRRRKRRGRMTEQEEGEEGRCAIRQIVSMSRSMRLFQHPKGEPPEGYLLRRLRLTSHALRLTHTQTHTQTHSLSDPSHSGSHSDSLILGLTHAQTHHAPTRSNSDSLTRRLTHAQTHSHSDTLTLRLTHTQTYLHSDPFELRLTRTQIHTHSDSFALRRTTHSHSDVQTVGMSRASDWFSHRRSLTDTHRKTCQEHEMHIWGSPRRVIFLGDHVVLSPELARNRRRPLQDHALGAHSRMVRPRSTQWRVADRSRCIPCEPG